MTPEDFDKVREVFLDAKRLGQQEREAFLGEACARRSELRSEVEALLEQVDGRRDKQLKAEMGRAAPVAHQLCSEMERAIRSDDEPESHPDRIGRYTILDTLGAGGMGIVYLAEQEDPRRRVALKVIHAGLGSRAVVRRFKQEAQLLGRLQHPGIAHVYEAGVAPSGHGEVPFFAMEYVDGKPLTDYADAHRLITRRRLDLFVHVCDAVQHAHQKGIIHRDLKPANILVDAGGQPKILDFGVARVTDADVRVTTLHTDVGQLIGTLPYMSPEQVAGDPNELDTRSDVYALGVVLYELLTARLPHDLTNKTVLEAARVIREDDPVPLRSIDKVLHGDIETIIGKALEKDVDHRYASASDLAADIRHYLANEPIAARPASTLYQLRKFSRRNRTLVSAVAVIFVALSGALFQMTRARNRALEAERLAADRLVQVGLEVNKTTAINQFFNDMLASADPENQGRDVRVADVLDRAAESLGERLREQPEIEASLQHTIGTVYAGLGLYGDAEGFLRSAYDARTDLHGDADANTLATRMSLAAVLKELNQWTEAEQLIRQTLETRRATLGLHHQDTLSTMNALADVLQKQGKVAEAVTLWRQTLDSQRQVLAPENRELLVTMNNLAQQLKQLGKPEEAEPLLREALAFQIKVSGNEHPDTLVSMSNLAVSLKSQGTFAEAEQLLRTVIEVRRRVLGDHPSLFTSVNNLARLLRDQGKLAEAEPFAREALEGWRRTLGEGNRLTLIGLNNVASLLLDSERPEEAEPLFSELLEIARRTLPKGHWMTYIFQRNHAKCLVALVRFAEAEPLMLESYDVLNRRLGPTHEHTKKTLDNIIELYEAWRRPEDAAVWRRRASREDDAGE